MKCLECGHENKRQWFHQVRFPISPSDFSDPADPVPTNINMVVRWACEECGRYHFKDGTIYSEGEARRLRQMEEEANG